MVIPMKVGTISASASRRKRSMRTGHGSERRGVDAPPALMSVDLFGLVDAVEVVAAERVDACSR